MKKNVNVIEKLKDDLAEKEVSIRDFYDRYYVPAIRVQKLGTNYKAFLNGINYWELVDRELVIAMQNFRADYFKKK